MEAKHRFLSEWGTFNVHNPLLQLFYTSIVSSTLTFGLACWGCILSKHDRDKLNRTIKTASVVKGKEQEDTIHEHRTLSKMMKILSDKTHPFYPIHARQRIERNGRFRLPRTRANRHMGSFFPTSMKFYNEDFNRVIT